MTTESTVQYGTASWQPGFIAKHQADVSSYLEQAAKTDFLQSVATCEVDLITRMQARSLLEVGCGIGVLLPRLVKALLPGGLVVGIDHSETFVEEAKLRMEVEGCSASVRVQQADAYRLPFDDATFDVAHCERVLMHLDDPSAALAEMKRVVRPGGWVVAVEPDWGGTRIDHADRAGMDLLYARAMHMRQPDMGLTLYRRMSEVGLSEIQPVPMISVLTDLNVMKGYGLSLTPAAEALVAAGTFTKAHADDLLAALEQANEEGRFYCVGAMHVVSGRVRAS